MTDLTEIEKPFGLLDKETQDALKAYKGKVEVFHFIGWREIGKPQFDWHTTYRAKPLKLPEWPAGLRPEWKWIAMDWSGRVVVYERRPIVEANMWVNGGLCINVSCLFEALNFDGTRGVMQ